MVSYFKTILFSLFAASCIIGCSSPTTTNDIDKTACTEIEISEIKDSVLFSDIIDEYQLIPLSNKNEYIIGNINQVIIDNEKIYISSDGVFCFDMKGNPIFKVNEKGGNKSELNQVSSISVQDGILYVHDDPKRVIHKYNSLDGSFIENISLPMAEKYIYKTPKSFVIETYGLPSEFYEGKARFLLSDNFSDSPKNEYLSDDLYRMPIFGQATFNNDYVLYSDYFNNNVYKIDDNGCCLNYHINFKEFTPLPSNLVNDMLKNNTLIAEGKDYQYGLVDMYESQDFFWGNFQGGVMCNVVHNKKSDNSIAFKKISSSKYQMTPYKFVGTNNGYFIHVIPAEAIIMHKKICGLGDILPSGHPDFDKQRVFMNCKADDNPIIALYKFKNF